MSHVGYSYVVNDRNTEVHAMGSKGSLVGTTRYAWAQGKRSGTGDTTVTAGRMPVYRLGAHGQARRGDYSAVRDALRWMAMAGKEGV